ncbi:hypothetical protein DN752_12300 [Echinicola strongylocentroti]|uniref:SGNH/GDSL hydrolase family protein n=2 Tax=Echinicola strongylocentroti TaxID=1795355 RepID=A0A2Z4IIS1_9BACT|nr:hypothetical protein DN752_12300 [Echinicola strongylocentroti]
MNACHEETPNKKPVERVLVIGNSITYHPSAPEIGWNHAWGMAASKPENDFFSILANSLKSYREDIQVIRQNVYPFERHFDTLNVEKYGELKDFGADLLIVRLGENVDTQKINGVNFSESLIHFVNYLKGSPESKVVITTTFWDNPVMNEQIRWAAEKEGWGLVDITYLSKNDENMALDEYENNGVARHPSDQGMAEIARLIWKGLPL